MFNNETRLNHIKQIYRHLLIHGSIVYNVQKIDGSYIVRLGRDDATYGIIPVHGITYVLSPIPEEE